MILPQGRGSRPGGSTGLEAEIAQAPAVGLAVAALAVAALAAVAADYSVAFGAVEVRR